MTGPPSPRDEPSGARPQPDGTPPLDDTTVPDGTPPPDDTPPPDETPPPDGTPPLEGTGGAAPAGRVRRILALLRRVPHPPWRSRRGVLVLLLLFIGFGSAMAVGLVSGIHFTETTAFCGRCHTMGPELKAHDLSPHRQVSCAECHVEPGVGGFVKAKARGSKQLVQVLTGTYPKPIPPPSHSLLPPIKDTCLRCHSVEQITKNDGPVKLVLRPTYQTDAKNTRELVAVILRPQGLDTGSDVKGVHWHIQQKVTYYSTDATGTAMDLIEISRPDGTVDRFIADKAVTVSADTQSDISRIKSTDSSRVMDCIDCHNRTGHSVPSVSEALDNAMAAGRISPDLPYVKRDSTALLDGNYATTAAADAAIDRQFATYQGRYPLTEITAAASELKSIYRLIATPDMKVQAQTYPDDLGHQQSPGCFRCHDGAHYQVVNGKRTDKTIPSTCATCHTFPQVGSDVTGILIGGAPASHKDKLYAFNHKNVVASTDPTGTSCSACHNRTYCLNCHSTGAITVTHDEMLYNHAVSIRKSGGQACAYCHQAVYCARCHTGDVLNTPAQARGG